MFKFTLFTAAIKESSLFAGPTGFSNWHAAMGEKYRLTFTTHLLSTCVA